MKENILVELSMIFAVNSLEFTDSITGHYALKNQFERSATSIGANIAEAQYGSSRKDFLNKMYIALKECAETKYWLELLNSCGLLSGTEFASLDKDCGELLKLLSSITKSIKDNPEDNS